MCKMFYYIKFNVFSIFTVILFFENEYVVSLYQTFHRKNYIFQSSNMNPDTLIHIILFLFKINIFFKIISIIGL